MRGWAFAAALLAVAAALDAGAMNSRAQGSADISTEPSGQSPFLREMTRAMDRMMAGMQMGPTGNVDADFAAMMIPHHQGAIDMAVAELRYGKNEQLRRIAQEIIVDQQQEIAAMRRALGQPLPPSSAAPTQVPPAAGGAAPGSASADHPSAMPHGSKSAPPAMQRK